MYNNIITKEYINENIRPFSGNDGLFQACTREAIQFDLCVKDDLRDKLLNDDIEDLDQDFIADLRLCLGYFIYSRALRTAQITITKYGATSKSAQESFPADGDKVQADSVYYKSCGEKLLKSIHNKYNSIVIANSKLNKDTYLRARTIGE